MRLFFPPQFRVGVEVVTRPLPHVVQPAQGTADGVRGHPLSRGDLQDVLEQRHRPTGVRVAEALGRAGEEGLQQVPLVFIQQWRAPTTRLILQEGGVEGLGVGLDPVVDALPAHAEHTGDVRCGAALVELQDGEGTPKEAGIRGVGELPPEAAPLPGSQVEPAHGLLLPR
jgi:hypothetical protein